MARRSENECAFCAEEIACERALLGKDWKTYCSAACCKAGEHLSEQEVEKLINVARISRTRLTLRCMQPAT